VLSGAHRYGGGCRHPSPEGAPFGRAALQLSEMKPWVDLEGSQMSSASLFANDLRRRVVGMVGRLDAGALTQPVMRPERGYVSLVSVCSFSCFALGCL
jgi:hypothetical protein